MRRYGQCKKDSTLFVSSCCSADYGLEKMAEKEEIEKLYLYCMGELRILIENPYEYNDLLERLISVKNTLEYLYEKTLLKEP